MFSKLAVGNVRRSFRDYGVYLLTLTFGVCLFYTFNSLDGQGAMIYLEQVKSPAVEAIQILIDVFSVFVAGLLVGTDNLQVDMQVPAAFGGIVEGFILLCVLAGQFFHTYTIVRLGREQGGAA